MAKPTLSPTLFTFLKKLKKNNDRTWFNNKKDLYIQEHASVIQFADEIIAKMNKFDNIETPSGKKSVFRIYRDVRFSKDKSPYKTHFSGSLKRATKQLRGSYYFHLEPGHCFVGGGFWGPQPDDLKLIRSQIALNPAPLLKILKSKSFKSNFDELQGEKLVNVPKGFEKDHPAADLLRYKQFLISKQIPDKVMLGPKASDEVVKLFRAMMPFFRYMSEILTTDTNGEALY